MDEDVPGARDHWLSVGIFSIVLLSTAYDPDVYNYLDLAAAQKGAALVAVLLLAWRTARGPFVRAVPLALLMSAVCLSLFWGPSHGSMTATENAGRALVNLLVVTILLSSPLHLGNRARELVQRIVALLPLLSVALGYVGQVFGLTPWRREDFAMRLAGGVSPAHLGMLCFGSMAALTLWPRRGLTYWLLVVCTLTIAALAGARTAFAACLVLMVPGFFQSVRHASSVQRLFGIILALAGAAGVAAFAVSRSIERSFVGGQFQTSGRSVAWQYFYTRFQEHPIVGYGLGAVVNMSSRSSDWRVQFFRAPHNEYLHFLVDLGIAGVVLFGVSQIMLIRNIILSSRIRLWVVLFIFAHLLYSYFDNTYSTVQYYLPAFFVFNQVAVFRRNDRILVAMRTLRPSLSYGQEHG